MEIKGKKGGGGGNALYYDPWIEPFHHKTGYFDVSDGGRTQSVQLHVRMVVSFSALSGVSLHVVMFRLVLGVFGQYMSVSCCIWPGSE